MEIAHQRLATELTGILFPEIPVEDREFNFDDDDDDDDDDDGVTDEEEATDDDETVA